MVAAIAKNARACADQPTSRSHRRSRSRVVGEAPAGVVRVQGLMGVRRPNIYMRGRGGGRGSSNARPTTATPTVTHRGGNAVGLGGRAGREGPAREGGRGLEGRGRGEGASEDGGDLPMDEGGMRWGSNLGVVERRPETAWRLFDTGIGSRRRWFDERSRVGARDGAAGLPRRTFMVLFRRRVQRLRVSGATSIRPPAFWPKWSCRISPRVSSQRTKSAGKVPKAPAW